MKNAVVSGMQVYRAVKFLLGEFTDVKEDEAYRHDEKLVWKKLSDRSLHSYRYCIDTLKARVDYSFNEKRQSLEFDADGVWNKFFLADPVLSKAIAEKRVKDLLTLVHWTSL